MRAFGGSFALALCLGLMPVDAEALAPEARQEIEALVEGLRVSGCRFQRNGTWYDGERAAAHLTRKYRYLLKRDALDGVESFIELAASRSSRSGKSYRVQCGDAEAMDSGPWFRFRLGLLRGPKPRAD